MKRWTDREGIDIKSYTDGIVTKDHIRIINEDEVIKKFHQIQKIEEELGIDLITLFKALKDGVWTNQEQYYGDEEQGKIRFFKVRLLLEEKAIGCIHNSMWKGEEVIRTLYFKDYGKTWSLAKENLEQ